MKENLDYLLVPCRECRLKRMMTTVKMAWAETKTMGKVAIMSYKKKKRRRTAQVNEHEKPRRWRLRHVRRVRRGIHPHPPIGERRKRAGVKTNIVSDREVQTLKVKKGGTISNQEGIKPGAMRVMVVLCRRKPRTLQQWGKRGRRREMHTLHGLQQQLRNLRALPSSRAPKLRLIRFTTVITMQFEQVITEASPHSVVPLFPFQR
mmetsp:Transcript_26297/g.56472  ORF Transcript_26297/g.56472 Transcript_26297/m.56472 type:complete len:205 (+) Transcript_26297:875-1489(+)